MLTREELQGSLYYPAAGTDLQPLLQFAHRTETFVYADWRLHPAEVRGAFRQTAKEH
jgi:hypothetical protein